MTDGASDDIIVEVLSSVRTIAVLGASPKQDRASHRVMRFLIERGYEVVAVNPGQAGGTILDRPCYARLADVPHAIDMVDVFRRSEAIPRVMDEVLDLTPPPRVVWLQLGIVHEASARRARDAGLTVVQDRCPKIEFSRLAGRLDGVPAT